MSIKLSQWAKQNSITYRCAWQHFKEGKIPNARQLSTGTIVIDEDKPIKHEYVVIYARVSSYQNKDNLNSQADRLTQYCYARGYHIDEIVKEVGSGLNDKRRKLVALLTNPKVTMIVVEHKDRLTRFGYNYIDILANCNNISIDIVNKVETDKEDLMQDLISIITSMCARYYGQRRSKRKTETIIQELTK